MNMSHREETEPPSRPVSIDTSHPSAPPPSSSVKPFSLDKTQRTKSSWIKRWADWISQHVSWRSAQSIEEEVAEIIEEHTPDKTQLGQQERDILSRVLQLSDIKISDIMIPRTDIVAVEDNATLEHLKQVIIDKEHTRMPVYKQSLDQIIGFVHTKDLISYLSHHKPFKIGDILRDIIYVPPSMKLTDLLIKMRANRVHIALVLDEYGGTDGLVTMEDIMEEIVGEIEDEHDEEEMPEISVVDDNTLEIPARLPVDILETHLKCNLVEANQQEDFDTVGGLIFFMLGRVPEQGEQITHPSGLNFIIHDADPRRIKTIRIETAARDAEANG